MRAFFIVFLVLASTAGMGSNAFELKNFSFGLTQYTPSDWKSNTFPDIAWTPHWDLGPFAARLGLGASTMRDADEKRFLTSYYQAAVMIPLLSFFEVEASMGYRTFHKDGMGSHFEWGGGFLLRPAEFVDRVYICLSRYLLPDNTTSIFRAGVALSF